MSKNTILIVDDERFFCNLLEHILEDEYQVIIATGGLDALEIIDNQSIDLVLLDIIMPGIDGYKVCERIKETDLFCKLPIIFLTVKNETEDEIKGFSLGAVDYITKPISPPVVKARVATHLALSKANEKLRQHTYELEQLVSKRTVELTREIAEKQKVYEKLHYLANYDQLTTLPNRNLFNERLAYAFKLAKRNKTSFSLLLIDLDRFKLVNDSLGHHVGDLLLEQVGQRLSACLRGVDTVARLGGDEFTVTLTDLHLQQDAAIVAEKIIMEISKPFEIHGQAIHIGSSIGITSYPEDTDELNTMLKNADMAMYEVKNKGKNGYAFFSPEMTKHASQRMELEKDLYQALLDNQLYLEYQLITNIQDKSISGVETLLRWKHPKFGQVSPEKIISIAEESDLVLMIGKWVIETACEQLQQWIKLGYVTLHMAINMSTSQFNSKHDCVSLLKEQVQKYQFPNNAIQLEITESLLLEDSRAIMETLSQLKELGILLSIDDFGTGYSSLSYLRRFPIDLLKIDQSFIQGINVGSGDDTLVKAIIAMGHSLNLKVVAEGVETREQLSFIHDHGCEFAQGYYFSKPVSAVEVDAILKEKRDLFY